MFAMIWKNNIRHQWFMLWHFCEIISASLYYHESR